MTRKKTASQPRNAPKARAVYELRPQHGRPVSVEAAAAHELAEQLAAHLHTDPYTSRAAAHLLHVCRAALVAPKWSARRVGVLVFQPDDQVQPAPTTHPPTAPAEPAGDAQEAAEDAAQQPGSRQAAGTQPEAATPAQDTLDEPDSQDSQGR